MAKTWVLKFPQVDLPEQPILVRVSQKKDLDLDLLATDGEVVYRGKVRGRSVAKHKADNYDGTDEDWNTILRHFLISKNDSKLDEQQIQRLESQCSVAGSGSKAVLSITFRTRIEDITSRLGAIELAYSEDTSDVDLFGWTAQIIDQREALGDEARQNATRISALQSTIDDLQKELSELVTAKTEHEKQLLSKFSLILNEKKLKIRNQQRVLQAVKVDAKKLAELQLTLGGDQTNSETNAKFQKRGKRDHQSVGDDGESDGFDGMDIDKPSDTKLNENEIEDGSEGEATASGSEDEDDLRAEQVAQVRARSQNFRVAKEPSPPPPPRELPFPRKGEKNKTKGKPEIPNTKSKPSNDNDEDEETASEDDEL